MEDLMQSTSPHYRRRARIKAWLRSSVKILLLVAVITGVVYGFGQLWEKYVSQSKEFMLETVRFETNGNMTEQEARKILHLTGEENVLFLDVDNLAEQLKSRPDIVNASVQRELPSTLVIELEERVPIAWLECAAAGIYGRDEANGLFCDSSGYLFRYENTLHSRYKSVPVLHVGSPQDGHYAEGEWLEGNSAHRGLAFLKALPLFASEGIPPAEDVDFPNDWSLLCRFSNSMEITFGLYEHERQLHDLALIMQYAADTQRRVKSANMIPSRNTPVAFMKADSGPEIVGAEVVEAEVVIDEDPVPPPVVRQPPTVERPRPTIPTPPKPAIATNTTRTNSTGSKPSATSAGNKPKPTTTSSATRKASTDTQKKPATSSSNRRVVKETQATKPRATQNNSSRKPPQQQQQQQQKPSPPRRAVDVPSFNY